MSIYSRDFRQHSIRIKNKVKISKFIPPCLQELIRRKNT